MKQSYYSSKLAWYIAREFLVPLLCFLTGFVILFLIFDLFDVLQDFIKNNAQFMEAFEFFVMRQPQRLVVIIPITFLLAIMYTFANSFSRYNEITALKASGVSLIHTCRYIWLIAVVGMVVVWSVGEFVAPMAGRRAEELEDIIEASGKLPTEKKLLAFHSADNKRDWVFSKYSEQEKLGVIVTQFRPNQTRDWELRAEKAEYKDGGWIFYKAYRSNYDPQGEMLQNAVKFYEQYEGNSLGLDEKPEDIRSSLNPVAELSSRELQAMVDSALPNSTKNACKAIIYERIFWPFTCVIAVLIALPLSIITGRSGMFANIGMAVGSILGYYVIFQVAVVMSRKGWIPAGLGLFVVTAGAIAGGCVMMYRKR